MRAGKGLFCFLLVLLPLRLAAQVDCDTEFAAVAAPRLLPQAASAAGFAPRGWEVEVQKTGDLNNDGRPDLVFVLHKTDPKLVVHCKYGSPDGLNTNPRLLAVAFAQADGSYRLIAQNSTLIPRWTESNMLDYFGEGSSLAIRRGAFSVGLFYFATMGGWDTGTNTFTFRWQNGRFELIGYENQNTKRSTLEESSVSVNYSTGVEVATDSVKNKDEQTGPGNHTKKLPTRPLLTLDRIGNGMEFEAP